jgi:hypothetical protein
MVQSSPLVSSVNLSSPLVSSEYSYFIHPFRVFFLFRPSPYAQGPSQPPYPCPSEELLEAV